MRLTVFHGTLARTRRAGKESQRRDDRVGRDDGVIRDLCTILDDGKFPLRIQRICEKPIESSEEATHDHAVLPDLNMIANGRRFYDGVGTNMDKVAYFHRIIVECAAISLVRRPERATMRRTDDLETRRKEQG